MRGEIAQAVAGYRCQAEASCCGDAAGKLSCGVPPPLVELALERPQAVLIVLVTRLMPSLSAMSVAPMDLVRLRGILPA
jgi:hypothetical protein